jgi:hypothetical protein
MKKYIFKSCKEWLGCRLYVLNYHFQQYFSYIMAKTWVPRDNHRLATSHWQTVQGWIVFSISKNYFTYCKYIIIHVIPIFMDFTDCIELWNEELNKYLSLYLCTDSRWGSKTIKLCTYNIGILKWVLLMLKTIKLCTYNIGILKWVLLMLKTIKLCF